MGIPESQLETWSHQGSITQSAATYGTIKRVLEARDTGYAGRTVEVFLQGSYGNDTNIFSESDVDVVIRLTSSFWHDLSKLPPEQQQAFRECHHDGDYQYLTFKNDVEAVLRGAFGSTVKLGTKAIKIGADGARRNADVVVALLFKRFSRFNRIGDEDCVKGIRFLTSSGEPMINYPKHHSNNLTAKHEATGGRFKPLVRILKNLRSLMVESGTISAGVAPSYFLEGLLYNVPNEKFAGSYTDAFSASINWILEADRTKFVCANEQYYLLRETVVTWPPANCDRFLDAIVNLWSEW